MASWSRTQSSVSQSSADSEHYAVVMGVTESQLIQSMLVELKCTVELVVHTD